MSLLSDNIKFYRKVNKLTQVDLAKLLDVKPTAVSAWEVGRNKPLMDKIEQMASLFKIKKSELLGEIDTYESTDNTILPIYKKLTTNRQIKVLHYAKEQLAEQTADHHNVIHLDEIQETSEQYYYGRCLGSASAGTGEYLIDDSIAYDVRLPLSQVPKAKFDIILQVNGDSMRPMFEDKDYIFIKQTTDFYNGQIGVFVIDNEAYLKKAYKEGQTLKLVSLNDDYDDLFFNSLNDVKFVGTVVN